MRFVYVQSILIMVTNAQKCIFASILLAALYQLYPSSNAPYANIELVQTKEERELHEKVNNLHPHPPRIITVIENKIYVAIGYALGNIIIIEGTDGILIVDTTESGIVAVNILNEFRKISKKPLKGIVITHFHSDHIYGAAALIEAEKGSGIDIQVLMHETSASEIKRYTDTSQFAYKRTSRQFGIFLKREFSDSNAPAFGPGVKVKPNTELVLAKITQTFKTEATYSIAGINFTLLHTPGETSDHITLWMPDLKVAMPGDNIYECFPNLYTIRGSPPRDYRVWYRSLDIVKRLGAKYLVPSHGLPIKGEKEIFDTITIYRDAIQFVSDQTLRRMNQGLPIDIIAEQLHLPPVLANHPFLFECYGQVSWCVRGVYSAHLGWFDGDPVNLNPLTKLKRTENLVELLETSYAPGTSGVEKLMRKADECMERSNKHFNETGKVLFVDLQWGLELAASALKVAAPNTPHHEKAKNLTVIALKLLGTSTVNNNGRNYYLSSALELEESIKLTPSTKMIEKQIRKSSIHDLLSKFQYRLRVASCNGDEAMTIIFVFSDLNEIYSFEMRHCILDFNFESSMIPSNFDSRVTMQSEDFKDILTKTKSLQNVFKKHGVKFEGNIDSLQQFFALIS